MTETLDVTKLLNLLSEKSLWQLLTVLNKATRSAALHYQAGDDPGDLAALRVLQSAAQVAHESKLRKGE